MEKQRKKIVIAEDEEMLLEILQEYFTAEGWEVETAKNGHEALFKINDFSPDVILSDIDMPMFNGLELLESLYAQSSLTPVIFLTGHRDVEKMQRAWAACAFEFLDKPFKPEVVLETAKNAFLFGQDYVRTAQKRYSSFLAYKNKTPA